MNEMEKGGIVSSPKRRHLDQEESYWREAVEIIDNSSIYYPRGIESIILRAYAMERLSMKCLNLGIYPRLKKIYMSSGCIIDCEEVIIHGCEQLEILDFGTYNFTIGNSRSARGLLRISSCPNLANIMIGEGCFSTYKEVIIMDLLSVKEIYFGKESFCEASSLIKGVRIFVRMKYYNMQICHH